MNTLATNKKVFYHGTSADNLPSILKHGLSCNENKLWHCSNDDIYLWSVDAIKDFEQLDSNDEALDYAFRMANESGQIACIYSKDCRVVVLKIELDESEVSIDQSCENMEGRGAVCINRDITIDEIVEIKISTDLSLIKAYFIALMLNNDYFNTDDLTPIELKIGKAFAKAEIYPEDVDDMIEWENVEIMQTA